MTDGTFWQADLVNKPGKKALVCVHLFGCRWLALHNSSLCVTDVIGHFNAWNLPELG